MSSYCTIQDVQNILPDGVVIGTNLLDENVNVLESDVEYYIENTAGIIDSGLDTIYRVPLIKYKEPDFSVDPIVFDEKYPIPIVLINAELAASYIYDNIIMAQQEPNESQWGFNKRALAMDKIKEIQSGIIVLKNQVFKGYRFARRTVFDDPRLSRPGEFPPPQRQAGK